MSRDILLFKKFNSAASLAILVLVAYMSASTLASSVGTRKDFYNELWGPAHLLVHGKSPYDTSSLNADLPAVWFPMAIGIFAPIGWLNESIAAQIWFLINITALFLLLALTMQNSISPFIAMLVGIFAYLFPPVINHFVLGQVSIISTLCMMLAAYYVNKGYDWHAAFFVALGLIKPQLGILAVIGLSFYYFQCFGLNGIVQFSTKVMSAALIMSLPLFIVDPAWMQDWTAAIQRNPAWLHPSIFSILVQIAGKWGYFLWSGIALGGTFICWHLWKRFSPKVAMCWTLGITTIVSPYIWSWDFVLLLPVWILIFTQGNWKKKIFLFLTYLIGWIGMAAVQNTENSNNQVFWWVPLWFMGALLITIFWDLKSPDLSCRNPPMS